MDKIFERIIAVLPFPVIIAVGTLTLAAWGIKTYQAHGSYGQAFATLAFQLIAFSLVLLLAGYYGISFILGLHSRPVFAENERGVCVAQFENDTEDLVYSHMIEDLKTAIRGRRGFDDVRILGVNRTFESHLDAQAFANSSRAVACLWGVFVKPKIVHLNISPVEQDDEERVPVIDFPNIDSVRSAILSLLDNTKPATSNPQLSISYLERQLEQQRQATAALAAAFESLSTTVASQRERLVGLVDPDEGVTRELERKRSFLLVAVSNYEVLPDLRYTEENANVIGRALQDVWPTSEVNILGGPAATRDRILQQARELSQNASQDEQIWLYFSGHTLSRSGRNEDTYLMPFDAHPDEPEATAISSRMLSEIFRDTEAAQIVIVLDTGYVGTLSLGVDDGSVILTSANRGEPAFDNPSNLPGSFTNALVKGLTGSADIDGDGLVSADELFKFVLREMTLLDRSRTRGVQQTPAMVSNRVGGAPVLGRSL